ncbi:MAG: chloride channel protein [Clostridia bacterium]|nr:chloride channel protein [Clostridia bacterium]
MDSINKTTTEKISAKLFGQMLLCGIVCGIVCGAACMLFAWITTICDRTFHSHDWMIYMLPIAGMIAVLLYDCFRRGEDLCTDALFRYLHGDPVQNENGSPEKVSIWLAPLIFISTCLAYLFGGSVGRVGSALQIGGTLGVHTSGRLFACLFSRPALRYVPLACGMAAGFTAILNAPVAGTIFGVEVLILSGNKLVALIPSGIASFVTWGISKLAMIPYVDFHFRMTGGVTRFGSTSDDAAMSALQATGMELEVILKVLVIAFVGTLAGRLFCYSRLISTKGFALITNRLVRVLVGTGLVMALTLLFGVTDYNGIGFVYVDATMSGESAMFAFLWKLILTCLTLGCGIRGGEIAPTIFVGATACFTVGCLIGLDPTLAAALGFVGALASVTNAPVAIGILGCEAICCCGEAIIYFAITAVISHIFSGTYGLYHEQLAHRQPMKFKIP